MIIREMTVEIGRSEKTRNLSAVIIQLAADGPVRGKNILMRRKIRRIETAKKRVESYLSRTGVTVPPPGINYTVKAAPDLVRVRTKTPSEAPAA